jgi:dipeptidyl-peptidase III
MTARIVLFLGLFCGTRVVSFSQQAHTVAPDRAFVGELERVGKNGQDYLVLGLPARGFQQLSLQRKLQAYYLYRAAIAGNDIPTHQAHRYAFEIKDMLEQAFLFSEGLPWSVRTALLGYLKQVWINHGHYDAADHRKFVPDGLTPQMLRQCVLHAASQGGRFATRPGESLEGKLQRLQPHIFELDLEPLRTNAQASDDVLAASFVNYYHPAITDEIFAGTADEWKARINVFFDFANNAVVPLPYKVGGLLGEHLQTVSFWLRQALSLSESESQEQSLRSLLAHYESGEEEEFRNYSLQWLRTRSVIDVVQGFIDPTHDPRGFIGLFGAGVFLRTNSDLLHRLTMNAGHFERALPWPNHYKRERVRTPVVQLAQVLVGVGALGPQAPPALSLPLYSDLRRNFGNRSLVILNIQEAHSELSEQQTIAHFYLPRHRQLIQAFGTPARRWREYLREVIGRNAGRPAPELRQDPRVLLGADYDAIEEARIDLVALYLILDPRLVELGVFPADQQRRAAEAMYVSYLQDHLTDYRSLQEPVFRQPRSKGAELVLKYLASGGLQGNQNYGVRVVEAFGNYYVEIHNLDLALRGVGELLARLQIIKSTADKAAATEMLDRFAGEVDPAWRANIRQRAAQQGLPRYKAYVFPQLEPVIVDNEIVDVRLENREDLTAQQLRFSRWRFDRKMWPEGPDPGSGSR